MSNVGKWLINLTDDGIWSSLDEFNTKEDAIAYGKENFEEMYEEENGDKFEPNLYSKEFYVGRIEQFTPSICADLILERIVDDAYDEVGEVAEGYLENVSKEEYGFLEERINNALKDWLDETKNKPTFFKIVNVEKIIE